MEITADDSLKSVEVKFENPNKIFQLDMNSEVKLTEFVKYVSDFAEEISINPADYESFQAKSEVQSKEVMKLVEYIYKIIESFNESIRAVLEVESKKSL